MKAFKISAILVIVIGCIHCAATPMLMPIKQILPESEFLLFMYLFVLTGLAVILAGWVQLIILKNKLLNKPSKVILALCIMFIFITGAGAVVLMYKSKNPFAYLTLLVGIYQIFAYNKIIKNS